MMNKLLCALLLAAGCGGSDSIVGAWKSASGQYSLKFENGGGYSQWDTQYPPASLAAIDPSNNPNGAKLYGTYAIGEQQLTITAQDGRYPLSSGAGKVSLSSTFSIDGDTLTAPGLVSGVASYLRAPSAP